MMNDLEELRQTVNGMEFDLDEFEKMLDIQNACLKGLVKTDDILQQQLDAQRACLEELVNLVESLQRQIDSLKTRGRSNKIASGYMPRKLSRRT